MSLRPLITWAGVVAVSILAVAVLPDAARRNATWVSLLPQLTTPGWSAWGLGLRSSAVRGASPPTGARPGAVRGEAWADRDQLGVAGVWQGTSLEDRADCQSQRLAAQLRMRRSDWEGAAALLEAALRHCPARSFANLELGLAYDRLLRPGPAVDAFERGGVTRYGREVTAADYMTLAGECTARRDARRVEDCARWLGRALELAPEHPWAAWQLSQLSDPGAVGGLPDPERVPLWRDMRLIRLSAEAYVVRSQQQGTALSVSLFPMARRYALTGDAAAALELYRLVQQAEAANPSAHYLAGLAASAVNAWTEADRSLQRALTLAPQQPNVLVAAARARVHLHDGDGALALYRRALALEGCIPEAWEFIEASARAGPGMTTAPLAAEATRCRQQVARQYEGEALPSAVGRVRPATPRDAAAMAGSRGFVVYGPGRPLPPGRYVVTFRVQAPRGTQDDCVRLDVSADTDATDGTWLSRLPAWQLRASELPAGRFVEPALVFDFSGGRGVEFRVFEACGREVLVDWISVAPAASVSSEALSIVR